MENIDDTVLELIIGHLTSREKSYHDGLRVLVVGGAGFIGSWLSESLVSLGANVTCLDNLSTGSLDNISRIKGKSNFKLLISDVLNVELSGEYDLVFYGASMPAPDMYMANPVKAMLTDSIGLYRILSKTLDWRSRVVYMSSSEIYGNPEVVPTPEEYYGRVNPIGLRSPYEESKRFAEALTMAFYREYGVDVRIARIFNTYGPRLDPNSPYSRVVTRFIERALRGEPIEIHGDGSQTRSFTFISDTVSGLLKLASCSKCSGEVFNIGSIEEVSIIDLAKTIIELTGSKSQIVHVPPRPDDPRRRKPDISKAMSKLGWTPRVSLIEGLKLTIDWFKRRISFE
ncbi:MAG: GDP-mannose 4,6-dehydratase [Acidilobaceae archaeon]